MRIKRMTEFLPSPHLCRSTTRWIARMDLTYLTNRNTTSLGSTRCPGSSKKENKCERGSRDSDTSCRQMSSTLYPGAQLGMPQPDVRACAKTSATRSLVKDANLQHSILVQILGRIMEMKADSTRFHAEKESTPHSVFKCSWAM